LYHYKGRGWRGFPHHLVLSAAAYLIAVLDYLRAKRTSLLTRKRALRAMQPLIVRSRGFCPCCLTEFEKFCRGGNKRRQARVPKETPIIQNEFLERGDYVAGLFGQAPSSTIYAAGARIKLWRKA
jgi:hypothetical protein